MLVYILYGGQDDEKYFEILNRQMLGNILSSKHATTPPRFHHHRGLHVTITACDEFYFGLKSQPASTEE